MVTEMQDKARQSERRRDKKVVPSFLLRDRAREGEIRKLLYFFAAR